MKALAIDSSSSRLCVAAMNGCDTVTCTYDIGMRQSETLLGAIDYAINKAGVKKDELSCAVLCSGPGTFTGLRLSFSALKALHLAFGTPIYAVPTLLAMSWQYRALPFTVLPILDARKDRFYAAAYRARDALLPAGDYTAQSILNALFPSSSSGIGNVILAVGSGSALFRERATAIPASALCTAASPPSIYTLPAMDTTAALFSICAEYIEKGSAPMKDFDGPLYLRPSDAEVHLTQPAP